MATALQLQAYILFEHWRPLKEVYEDDEGVSKVRSVPRKVGTIALKRQELSAREIFGPEGQFFEGRTRFIGRKSYRVVEGPPAPPVANMQATGDLVTGDDPMGGAYKEAGERRAYRGGKVESGDQFRKEGKIWTVKGIQDVNAQPSQGVMQPVLRYICESTGT